jgi:antirestriction protein ArdC
MSQTTTTESESKGNKFSISRELQQDFVDNFLQEVTDLAKFSDSFSRPWQDKAAGFPYNPLTGQSFSGPNMARLLMAEARNNYDDMRWLTFNQVEKMQEEHPGSVIQVRAGEQGIKVLRPEKVYFAIGKNEEGEQTWEPVDRRNISSVDYGKTIRVMTVFYPYTVFNAKQIAGFPPAASQEAVSEEALREVLLKFAACAGLRVGVADGPAGYSRSSDTVALPASASTAEQLNVIFDALGHPARENRNRFEQDPERALALDNVRGFVVGVLAGTALGVAPKPLERETAQQTVEIFEDSPKDSFRIVGDAARFVQAVGDFAAGQEVKLNWFPKQEHWATLIEDAKIGEAASQPAPVQSETNEPAPRRKMRAG